MHPDTVKYNKALGAEERAICDLLAGLIDKGLPKAREIQWDYKIIVRRKGRLEWLI